MRRIYTNLTFAALSVVALDGLGGCAKAVGAPPARDATGDVELTVYKDDFALVHDVRNINLKQGSNLVHLPSVSKQLDANSVMFDWPGAGVHPEVTGSTYNLGVASSQDLLKRMVGQDVDVQWRGQDGHVDDHTKGKLEVADNGTVVHTQDGYLVNPSGEILAPAGQSVVTTPQLVATVQSGNAFNRSIGVSYLTRGLSWSADYVASIAPDEKSMRLECWGTIVNHTGTDFPTAKIRLVAGSPNRAVADAGVPAKMAYFGSSRSGRATGTLAETPASLPPSLAPTAAGDFYAYEIPARADVVQEQMNRARMIVSDKVPIHATYSIQLSPWEPESKRKSAQVSVSFSNDQASGLGLPLPAGAVRAYSDSNGSNTYVGASDIADTPKAERVALTLSDAFDVYSKSRQNSAKKVAKHTWQGSYTTELHNEKKIAVEVRVVRTFQGAATVVDESLRSKHPSYETLEWTVPVPAGGVAKLTYTVNVKA